MHSLYTSINMTNSYKISEKLHVSLTEKGCYWPSWILRIESYCHLFVIYNKILQSCLNNRYINFVFCFQLYINTLYIKFILYIVFSIIPKSQKNIEKTLWISRIFGILFIRWIDFKRVCIVLKESVKVTWQNLYEFDVNEVRSDRIVS